MAKEDFVCKIANKSSEELYTPLPPGYKPGKTKYVIVTGSVISGIGKGIFTSTLGLLLKAGGLNVEPIKVEAYLNVDAGTLNPYRHGEVFVLDDGTETDLDLGSYERFLDKDLSKDNFITSGKIYSEITRKEREGGYMGRDVQFIPHVTGETKMIFRKLAMKTKADVVLIEIGGTVGDYENVFVLEAARELMYEEGKENVCLINLTYILEPKSLGEFKSKAAQLGLRKLMEMGLHPDIVVCRSNKPIPYKIKEKVSLAVNVNIDHVVGSHNVDSIYTLPSFLNNLKIDDMVVDILGLNGKFKKNEDSVRKWTSEMAVDKPKKEITVAMAGKYIGASDTYISIMKALEHCEAKLKCKINIKWIEATDIEQGRLSVKDAMKGVDGLIVPGGFGIRGIEGKVACIEFARKNKVPYLGLCYGFQMAVVEFARNVLGLNGANTTECGQKCLQPVICILPEKEEIAELGGTLRLGGLDVVVEEGTKAFELYGKTKIRERFRHRFNVNTKYIDKLEDGGLVFSGRAPKKRIMQILELPKEAHPYFIATQFHPEFTSKPLKPNPLFLGFVGACLNLT